MISLNSIMMIGLRNLEGKDSALASILSLG